MDDFQLAVWAVFPPLLILVYYYCRIPSAPSLPRLLLFFVVGVITGLVALGLQWGFEYLANGIVDWERITRSLPGVALRQLVEVGPIEEGSKLGGVVLLEWNRTRPKQPSTVFLYTIAVALGFAAEENWVYLFNGTASIFDRLIGTPVHALFSAPWGYALGVVNRYTYPATGYRGLIGLAWLNAVVCHALVNVLSSSWRYLPLRFLSYGLFPFLLWMFWRMEQLWRRSQGKPPLVLISSHISIHRYWQRGLVLFALMLGGNAIFGFFLLVRSLSPLNPSQLSPDVWWFIVSRFVFNLIPGLLAWGIYRYLRR